MMPFPRPEEVQRQFTESLQPIANILREEVERVFNTPPNKLGGWSFDPIAPLVTKLRRPLPDYQVLLAAFDIVKSELDASGWEAAWRTFRSETSVSIVPKLPRSQYD